MIQEKQQQNIWGKFKPFINIDKSCAAIYLDMKKIFNYSTYHYATLDKYTSTLAK